MGAGASWWYRTDSTKLVTMFKRKKKAVTLPAAPKEKRFKTVRDAYSVTKQSKPKIGLALAGIFLLVWFLVIGLGLIWGHPVYTAFLGFPLAMMAALFFFTRQAGSAAYASIAGQPGAAASVLMAIRKGWTTTPAVSVSRSQDMLHRSVGRAGIVLVGEGGVGVAALMREERKKTERFTPGVPVTEIIVGDLPGQVKLQKLQRHLRKMPKKLSPTQMREVRNRLKAVGGMSLPIPKGPMPKNMKAPKR